MADGPNPTLARRRLAVRLRQLREAAGLTLDDLASELAVSLPQASRLDTGARGFNLSQIEVLGARYELSEHVLAELERLTQESRRRAWWQQVDLSNSYRTLIGLERGATTISEYCGSVLPGLLQTKEYAYAAAAGGRVDLEESHIEQAVQTRLNRQDILDRPTPPRFEVIIDEAVLARVTGGPRVMREQLEVLEARASERHISMRVVGFEVGAHLGTTALHFIILTMGGIIPDVVYTEGGWVDPADDDDPTVVDEFRKRWNMLQAVTLTPHESRVRIASYIRRLGQR